MRPRAEDFRGRICSPPSPGTLPVRTRRSLVGSRERPKFVHPPVRGPALCDSRLAEVSASNTDGGQDYGHPQKALAPRRALLGQEALSRLEVGEEEFDFG